MSESSLRLVWVYPDLLSTYGDQGNALVVERRALQRRVPVTRVDVRSDQQIPTSGDIYLIGGGEDRPQRLAAERLRRDGGLSRAVANGAIVFSVCAGYQIIGHEFINDLGRPEPGLGLLDVVSVRGEGERCVGDVLADIDPQLGLPPLTGFENHQGVTHVGPNARPFARLRVGKGRIAGAEIGVALARRRIRQDVGHRHRIGQQQRPPHRIGLAMRRLAGLGPPGAP